MKKVALGCLVTIVALGALFAMLYVFGAKQGKQFMEPMMADLQAKKYDAVIDRYHAKLLEQAPREQWKEWYNAMFAAVGEFKSIEYGSWNTGVYSGTSEQAPFGGGTYLSTTCKVQHERGTSDHEFSLFRPNGSETTFVTTHKFKYKAAQ